MTTCRRRAGWPRALVAIAMIASSSLAAIAAQPSFQVQRVSLERLVTAMQAEQGYDPTRTTNSGRFQGAVYLRLARGVPPEDAARTVLFIDHRDWYEAFVRVTALSAEEVPDFVKLSHDAGQDTFIDARPGRVVREVREGDVPRLAANVRLSWPEERNAAESFAFEDLESTPSVLVRNERVVSFRLLDFGDRVVFDDVEGSRVRPLDGALGVLFRVIGLASVKQVSMAVAPDGSSVARGLASKMFMKVAAVVTVEPDGSADRGIPENRPDLEQLERRLKQPLELRYAPMQWEPVVTAAYAGAATSRQLTSVSQR